MTTLYLVFLVGLAGLRLWELRHSKQNWNRHRKAAEMPPEPLFPWMVLLHGSFFAFLPLELVWRRPEPGGPLTIAAIIVTLAALLLRVWTLTTLGRSWNIRIVFATDYPIVNGGPYRFIRHPNYLVVFAELLAIPLIFHLYWSAAILTVGNLVVLTLRIRREEAYLARNPEWVRTMAQKPRFLPFLF